MHNLCCHSAHSRLLGHVADSFLSYGRRLVLYLYCFSGASLQLLFNPLIYGQR